MTLESCRSGRADVVSTALVASMIVFFVGCETSTTREEASSAQPTTALPPPPPPRHGPARYLPHPDIEGWDMIHEARVYDRETLAQLVDRGAARFLVQGFTQAAAARYRYSRSPQMSLRIEIFEMQSHFSSFGVLADQISDLADPALAESPGVIEIQEAGVIAPGELSFFRGSLFIKLVLNYQSASISESELDEATRAQLPKVARALVRSLPGPPGPPPELEALPRGGRVRRSELRHPRHLLGFDELGPGISGLFGDPGPRFHLGVAISTDEPNAEKALESVENTLESPIPVEEVGDRAFWGRTKTGRLLVASRLGKRLAIAFQQSEGSSPSTKRMTNAVEAAVDPSKRGENDPEEPRPWIKRGRARWSRGDELPEAGPRGKTGTR